MPSQPKILVIDDEPDNFDVIDGLLESYNYELSYASSGHKALSFLQAFQPDLILLDVMMPEMNGMELCYHLKSHPVWAPIPIIMVTALTTKQDLSHCLEAGADDFISKPVNGIELRARIRSMLRIKQQYDNLQALLQVREDMVNMMVHDLRNPLTTMVLSTNLLRRYDYPREKQQQKLEQMESAGLQLQSMIDGLLLMAKLESGKMSLRRQETDLGWLCRCAIADFEAVATQKSLVLQAELPKSAPIISIDPVISRRIIDNLLSNAIKFSPQHQQISLRLQTLETGETMIQVSDAGPGVQPDLQQTIFEKYEVGTPMPGIHQTGLGLAFCKIAIEAHGGSITVENNPSRGATFTIRFPGPQVSG